MRFQFDLADGEDGYVAKVRGLHARYRLEREFLTGCSRSIRRTKDRPQCTRSTFELTDGLYEVDRAGQRSFLAVVNNRRCELDPAHVEVLIRACKVTNRKLLTVFDLWVGSRNRSSKSLEVIAQQVIAEAQAKQRQRRKPIAEQRRERLRTMTAQQAFDGSDGADTRGFMNRLKRAGLNGQIAAALFRCQKASSRAKRYSREHRDLAYDRKHDALQALCEILTSSQLQWGWKEDLDEDFAPWVLYVELPQGQVSFHSTDRGVGPEYIGEWDGRRASKDRIVDYCDAVLAAHRGDG